LTETESWTEGREEADGHNTEKVEEQADENGVNESEVKERLSEDTDGEGRHDHVGGQPLRDISWCS